jgi:hypothetical protein
MDYLTMSDYAEIKKFDIKMLEANLKSCVINRAFYNEQITLFEGEIRQEAIEAVKEYDAWILAYNNELILRLAINTPPKPYCKGCEEGQLNQMGHYNGCIPDPDFEEHV